MIDKITFAKNRGELVGIRVDAVRTEGDKLGVIYSNKMKHGYFVNGKRVFCGYQKNKYFNDFVTLIHEAVLYK